MKSARFASIITACGEPEPHLLLTEPAKDRELQAAIKAERVMTLFQEAVGTKADHGEVGFQPGRNRQYLIFPKSLKAFAGSAVVGIKYDLLATPEIPLNERASPPKPPASKKRKATAEKAAPAQKLAVETPQPPSRKVVQFEAQPKAVESENALAKLKEQVRRAMALLEEGKQVAAFNLLERSVEP